MKNNMLRRFIAIAVIALLLMSMLIPLITIWKVDAEDLPDFYEDELVDPSEWFVNDNDPIYQQGPNLDEIRDQKTTDPTENTDQSAPTDPTESPLFMDLTDDEIWMLATAIWLEARGESTKCQDAICSVVMNRMLTSDKTLEEVLYEKDQFAVAPLINSSMPDDIQIGLVHDRCMNGTTLPLCVTFFRAGQYHDESTVNTSYVQPYIVIDNTYFSHDIRICGGHH